MEAKTEDGWAISNLGTLDKVWLLGNGLDCYPMV